MIMRDRSLRRQFAWLCEKKQKQEVFYSSSLQTRKKKQALELEVNLSSRFAERKPDATERLSFVQVLISPYLSHISIVNTFLLINAFFSCVKSTNVNYILLLN